MLNLPLKMHARRTDMHLSISSGHSFSTLKPNAAGLSPRFPPGRHGAFLGPSPPASPALPSLLPRHGKKPTPAAHKTLKRVLITFGAVLVLGWLAVQAFSGRFVTRELGSSDPPRYEMVPDSALPDEPAAIIVTDALGKNRWTVSIPQSYAFPLKPHYYREICTQVDEISVHLAELGVASKFRTRHLDYYHEDPNFIDVSEAERQGLLGHARAGSGDDGSKGGAQRVCKQSLTYVLETSDAGLGSSLMGLWMAYGLAKKEGRSFFVDDSRWPYGKYSTYFKAAPAPGCAPPPASHRLPCPHSAAHLVVSAATFEHTFGHQFHEEFEDPKKMGVMRQEPIFALARAGYEDLFLLADTGDAAYAKERNETLMNQIREHGGLAVGLHVRRGDKHPWEVEYSSDYLPLTRYIDEARQILVDTFDRSDRAEHHDLKSRGLEAIANTRLASVLPHKKQRSIKHDGDSSASKILLASDDPDIYNLQEVSHAVRAQDHIMLASKTALEQANPGQPKNKYIDEIHGWEGGFYRDVFWGLGSDETSAISGGSSEGDQDKQRPPPTEGAIALRAMVGRAYLLDLAVLSASDYVVCGVSAMGCRLLAVMMGWDKAIVQRQWRNVDGVSSFDWTSIVW